MPKSKIVNDKQKNRIQELANKGLSTSEISHIMNLSEKSIIRYKGAKKNGVVKDNKPIKKPGKRRLGDPSGNINKKRKRISGSTHEDNASVGSETIVFVGGKKFMPNKEKKEEPDQDIYQCYNCEYKADAPFTNCPNCGAINDFED